MAKPDLVDVWLAIEEQLGIKPESDLCGPSLYHMYIVGCWPNTLEVRLTIRMRELKKNRFGVWAECNWSSSSFRPLEALSYAQVIIQAANAAALAEFIAGDSLWTSKQCEDARRRLAKGD
jgi:hypothetical protein